MQPTQSQTLDKAIGALTGLAIGDALGMPTQSMSPQQIHDYYGWPVIGLLDAVHEQPIAPDMKAGAVTDDTEQAFVLAQRLIDDHGEIDNEQYAQDLLTWEDAMRAKGSLDLLGPSTKAALQALSEGTPADETGRFGTTNGGAMRAAPVGIAFAPGEDLALASWHSCIVTHNTTQGIHATTLVAAAVSFAIAGEQQPLERAIEFVASQPERGYWSAKASVLTRTQFFYEWAKTDAMLMDDAEFADYLHHMCGTSVEANESIPAAFAIAARFGQNPTQALCFAASLGGDTDTMAAMAGAMLGAQYGADAFDTAIRTQVVEQLKADNHLDIDQTAAGLVALREATTRAASAVRDLD